MSTLVRQDPWSLVPRLQDEINQLFGNVNQNDSSSATATWVPAVDIHEYGDRFELYVDIPGVDPNKVEVNATGKNGVLTVTIPKQAKAMPRRIQIAG